MRSERRVVASATLVVLLMASISACIATGTRSEVAGQPSQHLRELYGVALSIIRPDYFVDLDADSVRNVRAEKDEILIAVESIPQTGFDSAGAGTRKEVTIRTDTEGDLDFHPLEKDDATYTLERYMAGKGRNELAKRQVAHVLKWMDDDHFMVTVIVELKRGMTDEELEKADLGGAQKALFPAGGGRLPIAWADSNCRYLSLAECDDSVVKPFRAWLANLTASDRELLLRKRIALDYLERLAGDGRVAGLMYDLALPSGMLSVVNNPEVRAVYLTGVQLRKPIS
ncbi:hypothetical protein [Planotetraspora sp. GP83]|uniref:hypothetical protein n=1 Tax=Planotetraspora sp. GP83 TaxID=3156264 RepID=UPI003516B1B2